MSKSGLADSPFFPKPLSKAETANSPRTDKPSTNAQATSQSEKNNHDTVVPRTVERRDDIKHDIAHDTVIPRHHDTTVETVRLAVKEYGKEAATHRFTKSEKEAIVAIVYAIKQQGIRTNENEITRIAVNFIIRDYNARGEQSFLAKAIHALNA